MSRRRLAILRNFRRTVCIEIVCRQELANLYQSQSRDGDYRRAADEQRRSMRGYDEQREGTDGDDS